MYKPNYDNVPAECEKPMPVISAQIINLNEALEFLQKRATMLEQRLQSVLQHEAPASLGTKLPPPAPAQLTGVPLGDSLAQIHARMRDLMVALDALLTRIEL